MVTISGNFAQDICTINNNKIVGSIKLLNSKISFNGKNNIFISKNATLTNSNIEFRGNNSIIYLNKSNLRINFFCGHHSNIYVGKNITTSSILTAHCAESTSLTIGDDCMFSFNIKIRTSDGHCIYCSNSMERVNIGKSIYIGDHVWIGTDCIILKNSSISSGSILGCNSVLSGKIIPCNTIYCGNPAKQIKQNIFWERESPQISNRFDCIQSIFPKNNLNFDNFIYTTRERERERMFDIKSISNIDNIEQRIAFMDKIYNDTNKYRFCFLNYK